MNTNLRIAIVLCIVLFAALLVASRAMAQTYEGRILGTVRDSSGGVVVNAKVTVTNAGTKLSRDLATNSAGDYVAPALEPGLYTVSAEAPGFKKVERLCGSPRSRKGRPHRSSTTTGRRE